MFRLHEIVSSLGGELFGDGSVLIKQVAPIERAVEGEITFVSNPRFAAQLDGCAASAVIVAAKLRERVKGSGIVVSDPYLYYARVAQLLNPVKLGSPGVHHSAVLESAVPDSVSIGPNVVIEADVCIGERVQIGANSVIGAGVSIGADTRIAPNVTIYPESRIGARCLLHAGVVVGADGFGFARERNGEWVKIPQIGRVVIGDDVEIGANTTVDRGALDDTVIANGVKIDNLVMVAHNVQIGEHTAMAGQSGIAGSTRVGARCMIGGQSGISGHLEVCDDVMISGCTLVPKTLRNPGVYTSNLPIQTHAEWVTNFSHLRHLDALSKRIRELEKQLAQRKPE